MKKISVCCLSFFLSIAHICFGQSGQTAVSDKFINVFVPASNVVFSADYANAGSLGYRFIKGGVDYTLKPTIAEKEVAGKYITFECDFRFRDTGTSVLIIDFPNALGYRRSIAIDRYWLYQEWQGRAQAHCGIEAPFQAPFRKGYSQSVFDPSHWHCLAASFTNEELRIFIDNYYVWGLGRCDAAREDYDLPGEGFRPSTFTISSKDGADIRAVRFAQSYTIPPTKVLQNSPFNRILSGAKLITYSIRFDVNSATIKEESMPYVDSVTAWLKQNPVIKLEVSGHTDSDGDNTANLALSQKRAASIVARLILSGIDSSRVVAKGYGEETPLQSNTTSAGKAANRRVEFRKL